MSCKCFVSIDPVTNQIMILPCAGDCESGAECDVPLSVREDEGFRSGEVDCHLPSSAPLRFELSVDANGTRHFTRVAIDLERLPKAHNVFFGGFVFSVAPSQLGGTVTGGLYTMAGVRIVGGNALELKDEGTQGAFGQAFLNYGHDQIAQVTVRRFVP